jgi:hypothetical protein
VDLAFHGPDKLSGQGCLSHLAGAYDAHDGMPPQQRIQHTKLALSLDHTEMIP